MGMQEYCFNAGICSTPQKMSADRLPIMSLAFLEWTSKSLQDQKRSFDLIVSQAHLLKQLDCR